MLTDADFTQFQDDFLAGYVTAMLWANAINAEGDMADLDLDDQDLRALVETDDAKVFFVANLPMMAEVCAAFGASWEQHGHDFALTRNRHGAGFWDRGYGYRGDLLTRAVRGYGEAYVYV